VTQSNFLNLSEGEPDQHVYRIMRQDYVIKLFTENVLSQVHNWKDKFENLQLKLGGILDGERFELGFKDDFVGHAGRLIASRKPCGAGAWEGRRQASSAT